LGKVIAVCNQKGGVAKCVLPGTKITLSDGTLECVENIFDKYFESNENIHTDSMESCVRPPDKIEVLALDRNLQMKPARITNLYRGHSNLIYSILTERGNHIAVTPDHPLMSISCGRISWIKASGLNKGMFVASARQLPLQNNNPTALASLSDDLYVLVFKDNRETISLNLQEILEVSNDKRDKLALFILYKKEVTYKDLYDNFGTSFSYLLIQKWIAQRIISRVGSKYGRNQRFALNKDILVSKLLDKGINAPSFKYLLSKGAIGYDDIIGIVYRNGSGHTCPAFYWNTIIDKEIAKVIAIIIAEGSLNRSTIVIQNKSEEIISIISEFCKRFNLCWKIEILKNYLHSITIYQAGTLVKILEDVFEIPRVPYGKAAHVKLPNILLKTGGEALSAYMAMYIDCDGHVSNKRPAVAITSASEGNIRRLQYAFLQFGIVSSVRLNAAKATNSRRPKKRTYFKLNIEGVDNLKKIYSHICPGIEYKRNAVEKHLDLKANTNIDIIPINKMLTDIRSSNYLFQSDIGIGGTISDYECFNSTPSRTALSKVVSHLEGKIEDHDCEYLRKLSKSDIFWDRIKSITCYKYKGYVYDLTVEKYHNFVCGDGAFISHNTTTSINLSSYLAQEHRKTLLLDIDPQSNATSGIGINKHSVKTSIYNVLYEQNTLESIILPTEIDNLLVAPSGLSLTGAEVELVNAMSREYRLKKAIDKTKDSFEYIIIDCPPSLGLLTLNALTAADSVIIPVQCEYYALEGLSQLMNTINLIRDNLNSDLKIEGVLMTMADYRTNLTKEVIEEVKKFFGEKVYDSIIPRSIKLTEAPGFGKPIVLYDKNSIGALAYHNLAKEVIGEAVVPSLQNAEVADAVSSIENASDTGNDMDDNMEGDNGKKTG